MRCGQKGDLCHYGVTKNKIFSFAFHTESESPQHSLMDANMKNNFFCFASLSMIGCVDSIGSSECSTAQMTAEISVVLSGSQVDVETTLKLNNWTYVKLEEGDRIKVLHESETKESYDDDPSGPYHRYIESFQGVDAGTEFQVSFLRNVGDSALESIVEIPDDFLILSPQVDTRHSRTEDVYIQWESHETDDTMQIILNGFCMAKRTYEVDMKDAAFVIPADDIVLANLIGLEKEEDLTTECWVTLELERRTYGSLDLNFGFGEIVGGNRQELDLYLVP